MTERLFDIGERVVVVTGATGVLAGGTAAYLQRQGAFVVYLGRDPVKLEHAMAEAKLISERCMGMVCDVLDRNRLQAVYREVIERTGRIDALVNGAGGNRPGAVVGPDADVFDLDIDEYAKVVDLNLQGSVLPTLVFGRAFRESGKGCVVNFSSMSSEQAITRVLGYSNAKAAIDNFTRWMATEMAMKYGDGIRVNAIAPGFFVSDQNRALLLEADGSFTERGRKVIAKTPFGRFGRQEEVYGTIHYLLSDAASFVTGAVVPVDGGFSAFTGV
jgi:NAD(P)-dependent dehydrogenase (short-subunit alcohol dehydrogenase family)